MDKQFSGFMTIRDIAKAEDVTVQCVYRWVWAGNLEAVTCPLGLLVSSVSYAKFIAGRMAKEKQQGNNETALAAVAN